MGPVTPRRLVTTATMTLLVAGTVGGGVLAAVERISMLDGMWLAFTVLSTTGFGDGPVTVPGRLVAMILFVMAAVSYLLLLTAASAFGRMVADEQRRMFLSVRHDIDQLSQRVHRN